MEIIEIEFSYNDRFYLSAVVIANGPTDAINLLDLDLDLDLNPKFYKIVDIKVIGHTTNPDEKQRVVALGSL